MGQPKKPAKPHKDFPLSAHANGQWCKKVRGKIHYFGKWSDHQAALLQWLKVKDYLLSGHAPPGEGARLADVLNLVLEDRKRAVESGDITELHWGALKNMARAMIDAVGKDAPAELTPQDWSKMRAKWAAELKPSTLAKRIGNIRAMMNFAHGMEYIPAPRFGPSFVGPTLRAIREGASARERVITRERYAEMLAGADDLQRCCLLVGLNLAYGQADIAALKPGMVGPDGIVNHPRPKTGVRRWGVLWPETLAMLGVLFDARANARAIEYTLRAVMLPDHTPYDLRHTFATIGDQCADSRAVDCVMGHAGGKVRDGYQHGVETTRLQSVAEFVRSRML